jgi:putative membrane protein
MIAGYTDHAANERTYLAWVRTGIAVVAFGFVIEKFNLFLLAMAETTPAAVAARPHLAKLSRGISRYEGVVFVLGGVCLLVLATLRFVRTTRLLNDPQTHLASAVRTELVFSGALVVLMAAYSLYLVLS